LGEKNIERHNRHRKIKERDRRKIKAKVKKAGRKIENRRPENLRKTIRKQLNTLISRIMKRMKGFSPAHESRLILSKHREEKKRLSGRPKRETLREARKHTPKPQQKASPYCIGEKKRRNTSLYFY